jgi:DNA-directed RNA polymerase subunit alpha
MDRETFDLQASHFAGLDHQLLMRSVDELKVSVRSLNILKAANLCCIGDLVRSTEADLLRTPHLGCKALKEIYEALASRGLTLGSHLDE